MNKYKVTDDENGAATVPNEQFEASWSLLLQVQRSVTVEVEETNGLVSGTTCVVFMSCTILHVYRYM